MNLTRIIKKSIFHIAQVPLKLISIFNHRFYMKCYIPLLRSQGMVIKGIPRYIGPRVKFDDFKLITIGNRVVISDQCHLLTHDYSITTALIANGEDIEKDIALIRPINIGNNVFIGKKSIIMPNTTIGNNVIIGAGSVVRGKVESDSIYAGNPAVRLKDINSQFEKWKTLIKTDFIRTDK